MLAQKWHLFIIQYKPWKLFSVGKLMTKCCSLTFRLGGGLLLHVCEDIPGKILSKYTSAEPI